MNNATKVLLAIGASVAIGAALGVLYAPEAGAGTRKKLMKRSKKLADTVSDSINGGLESLQDVKSVLQNELLKVNKKIEEVNF